MRLVYQNSFGIIQNALKTAAVFKIKWIYWVPQFVSFCHYTVLKEALSCGHVGDKKSFILAKENDDALPLVKKKCKS